MEQAVSARCNQLADNINKEIGSIRNQVLQPTQDEDDPMLQQEQPNGNSIDADDESEDHLSYKTRRHTKGKNNHHNWQKTMDDDKEDENDNGANNGCRRKAPMVLMVHNYPPQFLHELTNATIVCSLCISSMEGADGKGVVRPSKQTPASKCTCPQSSTLWRWDKLCRSRSSQ